ncbi:hypothetical protein Moror_10794 [Moniliophthora roreri MCA 2997]|uniref:Monopolin complex subunit Csm1/Pcs1 C-terminal domain-containing protein n=1 Tax=Moniliophthora roreri (strain MCA 2997) TaxID=1381753 RepID=V2WMG9_MONRO|nr:hypothetical protein Moror_10794 [Moniliophthora roreri MCA 2997]KAI3616560.1 hypothetical protein WG66_011556 [Moniliophthora roreri]
MSDNDSDLGGLGPVIPAAPRRTAATKSTNQSRAKSNEAGPSNTRKTRTRTPSIEIESVIDVDAAEEVGEEEAEVDELASQSTAANRGTRKPAARSTMNNKGKQRAAPTTNNAKSRATNIRRQQQRVEDAQVIEDSDDPEEIALAKFNRARKTGQNPKEAELERLRWRAEQAEQRCADLMKQLEEIHRTRTTEAEQLMEAQMNQYEVQLEAKERLISQLTQSLAKLEPMSRSGKTSVLHLITRDAADEERKMVEQEVARLKEELAERTRQVKERDELLAEKEQTEKELRYELKLERENAQKFNHRPPGSAQRGRGGVLGTDDPKNAEVIKFYEDITNLLVPSMKPKPGRYLNTEDWNLTCVYTYVGEDGMENDTKSLHFTLRTCNEPKPDEAEPITHTDQLQQSMYYVPLDLDKEAPDFVERLKFLGSPFSFPRTQLPLFLRTIYNTIEEALSNDKEGDDDIQIQ